MNTLLKLTGPSDVFSTRRESLLALLPSKTALIVPSAPTSFCAPGIPNAYNTSGPFTYLSGLAAPNTVLGLLKDENGVTSSHFFHFENDPSHQRFFGPSPSVQDISSAVGPSSDVSSMESFASFVESLQSTHELAVLSPGQSHPLIDQLRVRKDRYEADCIARACSLTEQSLLSVASAPLPSHEHLLEADIRRNMVQEGAMEALFCSVASSGHSFHPHYVHGRGELRGLVQLDVGVRSMEGYCSDISRALPVDGTMGEMEARVADAVGFSLSLMAGALGAAVEAGEAMPFSDLNLLGASTVHGQLMAAGAFTRELTQQELQVLFPHQLVHHIGTDVHDCPYAEQSAGLGAVVALEPGVYLPDAEYIQEDWRGVSVRLEDVFYLGEDGCEPLSGTVFPAIVSQ